MRTAPTTHPIVRASRQQSVFPIAIGFGSAGLIALLCLRSHVPAWAEMWLLAGCLFAFFKWLTWAHRSARYRNAGAKLRLGYLFGWVGLNVEEFCTSAQLSRNVAASQWALALLKMMCGAVVLWGLIPRLHGVPPVVIGGLGFAGLIVLLHFGLFHLLALAWRSSGVGVEPIMRLPLLATSLADFWGQRWNRAYRRVSYDCFFRPAVSRFGPAAGTMIAFLASGLIHDLVISFPAGAGYGGPTAYFVIQGLGLLLERTPAWRRLTSRFPVCGWFYTLVFLIGPVGLLFHKPFLTRVIVPFLEVIGAR
jgi:alginate O-acetyltransferase complex protein AlgI